MRMTIDLPYSLKTAHSCMHVVLQYYTPPAKVCNLLASKEAQSAMVEKGLVEVETHMDILKSVAFADCRKSRGDQ